MAERESEQLRERINRGKRTSAALGTPSTSAPWGYVMTRAVAADGKLRPQFDIDAHEAGKIREAVRRLLDGHSMYSVMRWIEQTEGFKPSSMTNLKRSLTNPALAGLRVHQGKVVRKASWDPIITEEQHYQLVEQLKRPPGTRPGPEPKHLLTGIAKCGKCGEGLRWRRYPGKRNPGYECARGHCSRRASAMDAAVEEKFFRLIPVIAAALPKGFFAPRTEEVRQQIKELEDDLADWREKALKGEVTAGMYGEVERDRLAKIDALRPKTTGPRLPDIADVQETWGTMSVRERREQIRFFLDITLVPADRRGARTGQLLIELGGELGIRDAAPLPEGKTWLVYRTATEPGDPPDGWVIVMPEGERHDLGMDDINAEKEAEAAARRYLAAGGTPK